MNNKKPADNGGGR
ncbi:hypothetical protein YPPY48_2130, partial [Yersinia pestis PY-48]